MKKYMNQANTTALFNAMSAVAMFSVAAVLPEVAQAQTLLAMTGQAATQSSGILQIIQVGCYIGGTIMGVATLLDAKKYSENPASNGPLGKVIGKGAVAAAMLSAPTVLNNIQDSVVTGSEKIAPQTFTNVNINPGT